jgi:hypothetical protein
MEVSLDKEVNVFGAKIGERGKRALRMGRIGGVIAGVAVSAILVLWLAATRGAGLGLLPRIVAPLTLEADLSQRVLYVHRDGDVVAKYGIAVGSSEYPTPPGEYAVRTIIWNPAWVPPDREWARGKKPREPGDPKNPMQGVKIYFKAPMYYIHGTNNPGSIGDAASHGCIRMTREDAEELALMLQESTGAGSGGPGGSEQQVTLPSGVPFDIHN